MWRRCRKSHAAHRNLQTAEEFTFSPAKQLVKHMLPAVQDMLCAIARMIAIDL
jgi:hypothetical protein